MRVSAALVVVVVVVATVTVLAATARAGKPQLPSKDQLKKWMDEVVPDPSGNAVAFPAAPVPASPLPPPPPPPPQPPPAPPSAWARLWLEWQDLVTEWRHLALEWRVLLVLTSFFVAILATILLQSQTESLAAIAGTWAAAVAAVVAILSTVSGGGLVGVAVLAAAGGVWALARLGLCRRRRLPCRGPP